MTDFTNLAALVSQGQQLLDQIKGGALLEMQSANTALQAQYSGVVANVNAAIPAAINKSMYKTIYVDKGLGNDANDGLSRDNPVASLNRASKLAISGGVTVFRMMSDYVFIAGEQLPIFYSGSIFVTSDTDKVKIKFASYSPDAYPDQYYATGFSFYYQGSIEFFLIDLELPDVPADHGAGKSYPHGASIVRTNSSGLAAHALSVRLADVNIIVPDSAINEFHIVGNPAAFTNLVFVRSVVPAEYKNRNKLFHQGRIGETSVSRRSINLSSLMSSDTSVYNSGVVA